MQTTSSQGHSSRCFLRSCLSLQFASLAVLVAIDFFDERFELATLLSMMLGRVESAASFYCILLPLVAYSLIFSFVLYAAGILFAERSQRTLRNLFVLTTMIGLSMALFTNWKRISWEGRRHRMSARIESLQIVSDSLQKDWPTSDMNHDLLGPIMAYPQWNPSTLILLTPKPVDSRFRIAAIDRSNKGVMRFELSSGHEKIWLEHRSDIKLDDDFTNGIDQKLTRQYYISLSPIWYLVRYQ